METTCSRCHQTTQADSCFCPVCGLPQLVYSDEDAAVQSQPERWNEAVRDAGSVAWKPALRLALLLAIPAGILSNMFSPVSIFGMPLMAISGAWVVLLYMRSQRPAWITIGAGARIGLVTGILGGWVAAATTGITLFAMRFWFHQGTFYDNLWQTLTSQMSQQWVTMGVDSQTIAEMQRMLFQPEGRAAWLLAAVTMLAMVLLLFAVAGGAIGARLLARRRRPEI
jgi:RNA polymerase subunit RPABC4/transcription elongation factor Spt4